MLSKKTKYALNALVHLAKKYEQGPVLISTISKEESIPRKFLESILLDLKNAGILNSKKGKGGGYYLLKAPHQVDLASVLRLLDGAIGLLPCVTFMYYEKCDECKDEATCGIRDIMKEVRDTTVSLLKGNSLQDIIDREKTLFQHLST